MSTPAIGVKNFAKLPIASSAPVELAPTRPSRFSITILNAGPHTAYLGNSPSVNTEGYPLAPNACLNDDVSRDAWYALCAAGQTATLHVIEVI